MNHSDLEQYDLPEAPGVYFFRRREEIIYIGKATRLRDRVRSYFRDDLMKTRGPKIRLMLMEADAITWEETDSVLEALILETNLIKQYQPEFNTREKDDKSYNHVVITDEDFPRVFTVRGHDLDKGTAFDFAIKHVFGPFPKGGQLKEALAIIRKIFPFRDKKSLQGAHEEFYRQIGLTPDTASERAKEEYADTIENIVLFFKGRKKRIIARLEKKMHTLAKEERFEEAERVKRQIIGLRHINDVSLIKRERIAGDSSFRIEAYDVAHTHGSYPVGVMVVLVDGEPAKSAYRKFKITSNTTGGDIPSLKEILERRLGHNEWPLPRVIVVDGGLVHKRAAEGVLRDAGVAIPVVAVTKNEKHQPKALLGKRELRERREQDIVLANSEAHRFAQKYHSQLRDQI